LRSTWTSISQFALFKIMSVVAKESLVFIKLRRSSETKKRKKTCKKRSREVVVVWQKGNKQRSRRPKKLFSVELEEFWLENKCKTFVMRKWSS
jgi:hypothetical protein